MGAGFLYPEQEEIIDCIWVDPVELLDGWLSYVAKRSADWW